MDGAPPTATLGGWHLLRGSVVGPAPTLELAPAADTEAVAPAAATSEALVPSDAADSDDTMARGPAGAALALATVALVPTIRNGRKAKG